MKSTQKHDERIANMNFGLIYPIYLAKVEKKGRTVEELHKAVSYTHLTLPTKSIV